MTSNNKPTLITPDNTIVAAAPDPFDLTSLRLSAAFTETAGVTKLLTTVPARRPSPQDFVRVRPAPEFRADFAMIDLKDDREDFLVRPEILPELAGEVRVQNDLHRNQPPGRRLPMVREASRTRRPEGRVGAICSARQPRWP